MTFEEEMIEFFEEPIMMTMKEEEKEEFKEPPMMIEMFEESNEEEEPVMEMVMEVIENEKEEEVQEEESFSETAESTDNEESDNTEQKEVQQKETKTVRLEKVLEKIETEIKALDKNLQLISLVKLSVMAGENPLEAYNIPFYEPKDIYVDQLNIQDNRDIYPTDLVEYKQNDPIFQKRQKIDTILQERQTILNELEVLRNG